MIEIRLNNKKYADTFLISNINFSIEPGKCICLVGANGSGKTTLINCLMGLTDFKGEILCDGELIKFVNNTSTNKYLTEIAYVSDETNLFNFLSLSEYLQLLKLNMMNINNSAIPTLIDIFKVNKYVNTPISDLSFGTKKKIQIILQLIKNPKYVIFDEPTNGLDPEMILNLKLLIAKLKDEGIGILLSTHQLSFCEEICDEAIVLQEGDCLLQGNIFDLMASHGVNDMEGLYKILNESYYQEVEDSIEKIKFKVN